MKADCHMHMVLDGVDWRSAIDRHRQEPDRNWIRMQLEAYAKQGFTYLRDGGDRWGAGAAAREMAGDLGIRYRTPLAPLSKKGHYGGFIGLQYGDMREFAALVVQNRQQGADFIKIMISGLMDFDEYGRLTEPGMAPAEICELAHIAKEEGMAVMAHANGARTMEAAAEAGIASVEHGAYADRAALEAMRDFGTVWVPTLSTIGNLRLKGRFREEAVKKILESAMENVSAFAEMGGLIAPGTDAGAWAVGHGSMTEYELLGQAMGEKRDKVLEQGIGKIMEIF